MNAKLKETLMFFQGMSGKMALAVSLAVAGFVMIAENSECIHAQAICQVGSDPTFSQPIKITGTGSNTATLSAANLTASRTLTFPDADGALLAGILTNNAPFISVSALGALDSSSTLTASTPLKSTALGQITAADLVPENDLTVGSGTANQILSVDGTGTALVFRNETTPVYTANAPYIKVDAAGAADSSSTLTANTPLKASATGQIEASDLDPTTDIAVGSATEGQILQVGSGSALVWANASGGGSVTLTAKGSVTGGRVVAGLLDSNELKVENITSFQGSVNDTDYNSTDSYGNTQRYNHYNAIADKYLQCFGESGYMKCRTGSFNTANNEITWATEVQVSAYVNYLNTNDLPSTCAYADDSAHNYYICTLRTSSGNDNYIRYVSFYIDGTGQVQVGDSGGGARLCWANYLYTYGNCGTAVPVWDMQTNTWVLVSAVNGDSSTMGTTSDYGIVISKNFVPNSNSTCNSVDCGFPSVYDNALKVNGPYNNNNYFNTTYWQLALDQRNQGYNRLHAVALDNGDSNDYEYAIFSKADSSGSGGNMEDGGWSAVHLERTSVGGNFSTGTVIENFNDKTVNTGTVNQFCGGNTNNRDALHDNVYGQGTTDVGLYFLYTCTENTSYGGSGIYSIYGNFFSPNPATNTLDMANAESIRLWETSSAVFGGGLGTSIQYFTGFKSMFKDDVIVIGGGNYLAEPDGTYLGCNGSYYCGGTIATQWNSTKTGFTPLSFKAYRPSDYTMASPIYNSDQDIFTFYFTNSSSGNGMGYITPNIDKNRGSWIGFLNASASDGDSVTLNILTGKATGLTGLVANTNYYVGGDGSLSTSGEASNKFCKAISTTECLILNSNFY